MSTYEQRFGFVCVCVWCVCVCVCVCMCVNYLMVVVSTFVRLDVFFYIYILRKGGSGLKT